MSPVPAVAAGPAAAIPVRIATIRARFEQAAASTAATNAGTSATATEFADMLSSVTGAATGTTTGATSGEAIVDTAMEYQGIPYLWGGTDPSKGLDCSGFVQLVLSRHGIQAPRVSADQAKFGTEVASLAEAQPGDLIAFGSPRVNHIGIYIGNGQMIHAPRTGDVVRIAPVAGREIASIRRVTGMGSPTGTGTTGGPGGLGGMQGSYGSYGTGAGNGASVLPAGIVPQVRRFESLFIEAGQRWGIDPSILAAQAQKESGGNLNAVSSAGALGLMQFMPATAAARGVNPHDPASAINGAAQYLSEMLQQFGSMELALAAYNAGPGAVRRAGNTIPYAETARYTRDLLALARSAR
jgi:cell wall-associated NlpC family hydrolase